MKHVNRSVLLWYSPREMYDLVTAIDDYPRFLPWCSHAQVVQVHEDGVTARIGLAYAGVTHEFTTRNEHVPGEAVVVRLVDGPFSLLDGHWRFIALPVPGAPAGAATTACKIEFELRYAFSNGVLEAAISPVFDRIANTFVDSFVRRVEQVHGAR